ncbi:MAG: hypothetical protein JNL01_04825 [Bdellovibrionales bacterium]|nr:hypothetical protein [Bdellovibrionales bacterium]
MKKRQVVFTFIHEAEAPQAQVMFESVKKHHQLFQSEIFRIESEGSQLTELIRSVGLEQARATWIPRLCLRIFERKDVEQILYMDPGSYLFKKLDFVHSPTPGKNVALIPRILGEETEGATIQGSIFDSGILSLRKSPQTITFLNRWVAEGARFLDLSPALYDCVEVIRDRSVAVAYWNIQRRSWNRKSVTLFNFRGFDPERPYRLSAESALFTENLPHLRGLVEGYRRQLEKQQKPESDSLILWN